MQLHMSFKEEGASQVMLVPKNPLANAGDAGDLDVISGLGRPPGEGNGNPLPYSCQENSMDRRARRATVHGVTKKSDTTKQLSMQVYIYIHIYGDDQIPILDKGLLSGRGVRWLQLSWECFSSGHQVHGCLLFYY